MNKVRRHWRIWLAVPAAAVVTVLGLTIPAQARPGPPARPAPIPATIARSLRSLDEEHAPAGDGRWVVSDPEAFREAVKTGNWVYTPYGLSYKTCVYHAPNHALIHDSEILAPSGAIQRITPCAHPTLSYPGSAKPGTLGHRTRVAEGPCYFNPGGQYWAASCYGSAPAWVGSMDQEYAVPTDPAKDGALIFLWDGVEDAKGDTLLQDVLTWGANGSITNPNIWYVTPWYLWGGNSVTGASFHVQPADTILAGLIASDCDSAGACTWVLSPADKTTGQASSLTVGSDATFDLLIGAAMEIPRASGCVETPASGHAAFRDLTVTGDNGKITPDFGTSTPDPQCNVSMTQSATAADILWKP